MSEENTELVKIIEPEVLVERAKAKELSEPKPTKTLREEIRDILIVTFVCESSQLRDGDATLPIETCLKVYRTNPKVFYYINKQLFHVMEAIEHRAKHSG